MVAPKGNNYHERFKTPAERQIAFKAFCDHIAQGYSKKSFHQPCVENTIMLMLEKYPTEFDMNALEAAKAAGINFFERVGIQGMMGEIKNFNGSVWQCHMQNRAGWKENIQVSEDPNNPTLSPADKAVIEHFKKKAVLEYEQSTKPKKDKK